MRYTIKNEKLTAEIESLGAEKNFSDFIPDCRKFEKSGIFL